MDLLSDQSPKFGTQRSVLAQRRLEKLIESSDLGRDVLLLPGSSGSGSRRGGGGRGRGRSGRSEVRSPSHGAGSRLSREGVETSCGCLSEGDVFETGCGRFETAEEGGE